MSTDELQNRYDELDNIIGRLDLLMYDIKIYNDFKEELELIKHEAQKMQDEVEPELSKRYDEEDEALEKGYWDSQF